MGVKLTLGAEDFAKCYGIMIIENEDFLLEVNQLAIPFDFMEKLKKWYDEYYKYTGLSMDKSKSCTKETEYLDTIGIELVKEIYNQKIFKSIDRSFIIVGAKMKYYLS